MTLLWRRPHCFSHLNANYLALEQLDLHNKSSEVCIKTRSPPASLPFKGQVTEQATVKWPIGLMDAINVTSFTLVYLLIYSLNSWITRQQRKVQISSKTKNSNKLFFLQRLNMFWKWCFPNVFFIMLGFLEKLKFCNLLFRVFSMFCSQMFYSNHFSRSHVSGRLPWRTDFSFKPPHARGPISPNWPSCKYDSVQIVLEKAARHVWVLKKVY